MCKNWVLFFPFFVFRKTAERLIAQGPNTESSIHSINWIKTVWHRPWNRNERRKNAIIAADVLVWCLIVVLNRKIKCIFSNHRLLKQSCFHEICSHWSIDCHIVFHSSTVIFTFKSKIMGILIHCVPNIWQN